MKKFILFLAIAISLSATKTFAQDQRMQMQQAYKSYLKDSVKLSDVMVDSVMAVRAQYQPQMRTVFMDQSSSMQDKQTKMQSMRTEMEARYKSAGLTDDQVAAIHKHDDEMRAQMMQRMNNNGGGGN